MRPNGVSIKLPCVSGAQKGVAFRRGFLLSLAATISFLYIPPRTLEMRGPALVSPYSAHPTRAISCMSPFPTLVPVSEQAWCPLSGTQQGTMTVPLSAGKKTEVGKARDMPTGRTEA